MTSSAHKKPNLSFWQIWNMSFGFLGIQFGWTLQMNNMSAIYEYLGAKPEDIPLLWLAAPMTGLIIQPIIGYMSDRTWMPNLGRRRPYFLVGAILSSLMLFVMPQASAVWMAAGTLWILDSSINVSMEPFRAFVADKLNIDQRSLGFAMQSMFIGLGSFVAGFLPSWLVDVFGVSRDSTGGKIPMNIQMSFYIGGAVFLGAVLYTVFRSTEYPPTPEELRKLKEEKSKGLGAAVSEIWYSITHMPGQMKKIALVQFFTWPGLFLMWFYYSPAVAMHIFNAPGPESELYTKGIEYAGKTFSIENLITFLFAFALPFIAKKLSNKYTHALCLLIGGLSLISLMYIQQPQYLFLLMAGVGIAWASILSMPYAMLSGSIPPDKMGIFMGIFNFFIVLPEIIASLFFGKFMSNVLHNDRIMAVAIGGCLLIIAALLTLRIKENTVVEA